jgi:hypothetical protein
MAWTQLAEDRWSHEDKGRDKARHLLLKKGRRYIELHGSAVHVYNGPAEVADPALPLPHPDDPDETPDPAEHAVWAHTGSVNVADDDEAWKAMEEYSDDRTDT